MKRAFRPFSISAGMKTCGSEFGAGDESRTRDLNLGKVALYQLSYSRIGSSGRLACANCLRKPHFYCAPKNVILSAVALINLVIDQKARILHDFLELVLPAGFYSTGFAKFAFRWPLACNERKTGKLNQVI